LKPGRLFLLGTAAGAAAVGVSFALRLLFNVAYLPELASSALFSLVPGFIESRAVESLGPLAKETAYASSSVLLALVLGLIPVLLQRYHRLPRGRSDAGLVFMASSWAVMLLLSVLFVSLTQVSTIPIDPSTLALGLLAPGVVFGAVLAAANLSPRPPPRPLRPTVRRKGGLDKRRRLFIKSAAGTAVAAAILYYGVGFLFPKQQNSNTVGQEAAQVLAAQVTPNSDFYRVDINVFAPSVDSSTWSLNLGGLVGNPTTVNYNQLLSLPPVQEYATLECVSSQVGDHLMSTALWKGVSLKSLLDMAGPSSQADYVVFKCFDGYDVGIPLDKAMADGTILAYEMNGEPLPKEHGYPVRAIVPGLYGMMNAKWITEIELVSGTYDGFWQRRGWANDAAYQTGSTVITPGDSALRERFALPPQLYDVSGSPVPVVGVAFAGDRGIQKVEVSTDRGSTWQVASLVDPLSKFTWVFWKLEWNPPSSGAYLLMVRATDGTGQVQVATMSDPFPSGATGYDVVDVQVSGV
jgi:DMSO/TMAO reductase YedYZ molybdopterin-dependent catalytic subunit